MSPWHHPSVPRRPPDRLALGPAARLLGVDPDTLRRWADDGRVEAFTTPGGHRRFDRARDRAPPRGPPARPRRPARVDGRDHRLGCRGRTAGATLGRAPTTDVRRRGPGRRPRGVPDRRSGPRRVARRATSTPTNDAARVAAEARAAALTEDLGSPSRRCRPQPDRVRRAVRDRPAAVPRRAGRHRPPSGAHRPIVSARCSRTPRRCSTASCSGSSPPTRRHV